RFARAGGVAKQPDPTPLEQIMPVAQRNDVAPVFDAGRALQAGIFRDKTVEMMTQRGAAERRVHADVEVVMLGKYPAVTAWHCAEIEYRTTADACQRIAVGPDQGFKGWNVSDYVLAEHPGAYCAGGAVG